ncbi:hypothetical protein AB0M43_39065 [Longispora sp. NPDC051575]|uniref:hypothetical protein n=1 Tax=Longispora sp. NPDC051575 TaxID=3154943 RepID=UPI003418F4D8
MTPFEALAYAHARLSALLDRADADEAAGTPVQHMFADLLSELHRLRVEIDPHRHAR